MKTLKEFLSEIYLPINRTKSPISGKSSGFNPEGGKKRRMNVDVYDEKDGELPQDERSKKIAAALDKFTQETKKQNV